MNTTVPRTTKADSWQRLQRWREVLQPIWTRYWPLIILAISLVWLGVVLHRQSLNERLARYYELQDRTHPVSAPVTGKSAATRQSASRDAEAYESGRRIGAMTGVLLWVVLPYLLLLSALGHYQYWHVTRQVLLAPGPGSKWAYAGTMLLLWFILLAMSLFTFGKQSARAGVVDLFPLLTVGYLAGYSMVVHFRERQREERELAQAGRQAELSALKAQVNPPFLFHALQGLHQTAVAENLPRTVQSLEQLTGIMQYVLEESRSQTTAVAREMEFIRDYLRLQQLRVPNRDNIRITTELDWDGQPAGMVPLLLNPLVENAFKYGISMQHPCFVTVRFRVADNLLTFTTENSVLPRNDLERGTGLGLKNVRRRLELAYPERHKLTLGDQDGVFTVQLKIKLD